ncbi:MAG: ABC transporter permease subunit [Rhizobiales bacterium]|nr:ABC transporter permease subunit [Hyphomicrobiales bacterium]
MPSFAACYHAPMTQRQVKAAVLLIGDELLSGRTQDINLQTIAKFLAPLGVQLGEARVVADVPEEIINAAIMDSGSFWKIFFEIILPMSANIMIVVLILMITTVWNDYLIGLTFGGVGAQPMTVILANTVITSFGEVQYNVDMAAAVLTALPPLVVYFALGRFFVQGITSGAIKG